MNDLLLPTTAERTEREGEGGRTMQPSILPAEFFILVVYPCHSKLKYNSQPHIITPFYPCWGYAADFNVHFYTLIK